jgi:hypothetical protein
VIKGCAQKRGVEYEQTFSPVARASTIRTLLSIAASENLSMIQFDVSTAFLYGELEEEIYMNEPQGYEDGTDRVCKLRKSLYGLKQAPRFWNKKIGNLLKESGLKQSNADPCLYILEKGKEKLFLILYVDDGLIVSTTSEILNELVSKLKKEFKITVKPAAYFLGLEIEQTEGCIKVSQSGLHEESYEKIQFRKLQTCKYTNDEQQ